MKNRQLILLIVLLLIVFSLTALVMKFYTPKDATKQEEVQTLRERQEIQILLGQAYFLMSNGNYDLAENALTRLFEKSPNNILALQMSGQIYFNTKRYSEAENIFRKLINLIPDNASNYNNLGQTLAQQGDYKKAVTYLEKAIALTPNVVTPYFNLAELYLKLHDKKQAIETLRKAFDIAIDTRVLFLNLSAFRELEDDPEYNDLINETIKRQLAPIAEKSEGANE